MNPKIDPKELPDIVEEAARIEQREELDTEDARDVLRELDLSPKHLEEARAAVATRREEAKERKTRVLTAVGVVLVVAAIAGGLALRSSTHTASMAAMTASHQTLKVGSEPMTSVSRKAKPELMFEVALSHAPRGEALDLTCSWSGPGGDVRRENHWKTKSVETDTWLTHCRNSFGSADPAGEWSVTMKQDARTLATQTFRVE